MATCYRTGFEDREDGKRRRGSRSGGEQTITCDRAPPPYRRGGGKIPGLQISSCPRSYLSAWAGSRLPPDCEKLIGNGLSGPLDRNHATCQGSWLQLSARPCCGVWLYEPRPWPRDGLCTRESSARASSIRSCPRRSPFGCGSARPRTSSSRRASQYLGYLLCLYLLCRDSAGGHQRTTQLFHSAATAWSCACPGDAVGGGRSRGSASPSPRLIFRNY